MEYNETWVRVKGYERHYEVSNLGRIRSRSRFVENKRHWDGFKFYPSIIKRSTPHYKNGYHSVMLKVGGVEKRVFVHRLVAEHFIPNPDNKPEVNHKDADKNNNKVGNLEWATGKENTHHAISTGRMDKFYKPLIAVKDMVIMEFKTAREASKYVGVSDSWIAKLADTGRLVNGYLIYKA